ncbi:MAG: PEGA domain-containing protein [Planctomycetota bacterium]
MRVILVMLLLVGGAGCVERTIEITSEPSGALVYLNDEEVGRTPVRVPFTFYGVYDVRLEREGYEPKWTTGEAAAPWWDYPGPDLVAEMVPGAASRVAWHYELEASVPVEEVDTDALLERARELRERAE